MKKVNLDDIIPNELPLDSVYTLIRINSNVLREDSDKTDEDTVARELISYIIKKAFYYDINNNRKRKDFLLYQLRLLAQDNKLPTKALLYFLKNDYISKQFYSHMDKVLLNTSDKALIKELLDNNASSKTVFKDKFGRTTNTVRLYVQLGDYEEAKKEFDKVSKYYGPNSLKTLYSRHAFNYCYEEVVNDELFLLLNDIKNSEFSDKQKKDFVNYVTTSDSVELISLKSIGVVKEMLDEVEFDNFRYFLIAATAIEQKGIFDYSESSQLEGYNIHSIKVADVDDYKAKVYTKK